MAIRFDNAADRLLRTNPDVGATELYTWLVWAYLSSDRNFYSAVYSINTNDQATNFNLDATLLNIDGVSLQSYVGDGADSAFSSLGTVLVPGNWYFIAGQRFSTTSYRVYLNGVLDSDNTYSVASRSASFTREEIAENYSNDQYRFDGRQYNFMFYRKVLTAEQIRAQMFQYEPIFAPPYLRLWTPMRDRGFRARHYDMVRGQYWTVGGTLTDEPNPKIGVQRRRYFYQPFSISGPITVTVNQVTETDTAQALTRLKRKEIAQVTETDLAQAIAAQKVRAVAQVAEADEAQAIARIKRKEITQVSETDLAQPVSRGQTIVPLNQVTETDTAQAVTKQKAWAVAQVSETDTAQALARLKQKSIGQVSETDLAQPFSTSNAVLVLQVTETDVAQAVTKQKARSVAQVSETDTAQALARLKQKSIGQVSETDLAQAIVAQRMRAIAQVTETDLAQALTRLKRVTISQTSETDIAQRLAMLLKVIINQVNETDMAMAVIAVKVPVPGSLGGLQYPVQGRAKLWNEPLEGIAPKKKAKRLVK